MSGDLSVESYIDGITVLSPLENRWAHRRYQMISARIARGASIPAWPARRSDPLGLMVSVQAGIVWPFLVFFICGFVLAIPASFALGAPVAMAVLVAFSTIMFAWAMVRVRALRRFAERQIPER